MVTKYAQHELNIPLLISLYFVFSYFILSYLAIFCLIFNCLILFCPTFHSWMEVVTPGENNPNTSVSDTDATSPTHGDATPAVPIFDENGVEIPPANPAPQVAPADGRVVPWTERAIIGLKTFCTSGAPIPTVTTHHRIIKRSLHIAKSHLHLFLF